MGRHLVSGLYALAPNGLYLPVEGIAGLAAASPGDVVTKQSDGSLALQAPSGGSFALAGASDAAIASPADGDLLQYQTSDGKWHNVGGVSAAKITSGILPASRGGTGQSSYATGDLLYASAANALARRAIGSTGQVLVVLPSGVPGWQDLTGGGGAGGTLPWWVAAHPNTPPASANAEDDEFESTTRASKWTQTLSGSPSVDYHTTWKSHAYARKTADGNVFKLAQSFSASGDFSVTALCKMGPYPVSTGNPQALLFAQAGANNAVYAKWYNINGTPSVALMTQDNGTFTDRGALTWSGQSHVYMHLQRSASDWSAWFSSDGYAWVRCSAPFSKSLTVDTIAIEIDFGNLASGARAGWDWFRRDYLPVF